MHEDAHVTRTDAEHALGRQLNFAAKSVRSYLEQRLAAAGASFAVWTALFALKTKGPLIQRELAGLLNVEGPTLTRHLARMEAEGLIDRHRTSTDRRAALVRLTDAARPCTRGCPASSPRAATSCSRVSRPGRWRSSSGT